MCKKATLYISKLKKKEKNRLRLLKLFQHSEISKKLSSELLLLKKLKNYLSTITIIHLRVLKLVKCIFWLPKLEKCAFRKQLCIFIK